MSQLQCFISTDVLVDSVRSVGRTHSAHLIFQRFKSESFPAGFRIMKFDEPLAQIYNDDEFKLIYLSLTNTPNSSTDWGFVDRQEDSLIEISGGRRR